MTADHNKKLAAAMSPAEIASRNRRIARAIKSGVSIKDAVHRFGIGDEAIARICDEMGVQRPKGGSKP